jgi:hypothetical protein
MENRATRRRKQTQGRISITAGLFVRVLELQSMILLSPTAATPALPDDEGQFPIKIRLNEAARVAEATDNFTSS